MNETSVCFVFNKEEIVPVHADKKIVFAQIILALGNYMNSNKRGAAYGFKLQSLDMVSCYLLVCACVVLSFFLNSFPYFFPLFFFFFFNQIKRHFVLRSDHKNSRVKI